MFSRVQGCAPHHVTPWGLIQFIWLAPFSPPPPQGTRNMLPLHWVAIAKATWETVVFLLTDLPRASQELPYLWPHLVEEPCQGHVPAEQGVSNTAGSRSRFGLVRLPFHHLLHLTSTSLRMQAWQHVPVLCTLKLNLHSFETKAGETLREFKGRAELHCRNKPQMETAPQDGERVLPATDGCTLINPLAWANTSIICIGVIYTSWH